jgi:hypothetical protein
VLCFKHWHSCCAGTTLMSADFKDGAELQTMEPGFSLTLRKRTV